MPKAIFILITAPRRSRTVTLQQNILAKCRSGPSAVIKFLEFEGALGVVLKLPNVIGIQRKLLKLKKIFISKD